METLSRTHRPLVYCSEATVNVYGATYGWWCMDCTAGRNPDKDGTNKAAADRQAKRHRENPDAPRWCK